MLTSILLERLSLEYKRRLLLQYYNYSLLIMESCFYGYHTLRLY